MLSLVVSSQEKTAYIQLIQAPRLEVDAGTDQTMNEGNPVNLGNDLDIVGGTPDYEIRWEFPDGAVHNSATIIAGSPGVYNLRITDANKCVARDSVSVYTAVSTDDMQVGRLRSFPNPVSGILHINHGPSKSPSRLTIMTITGKMIFSTAFPSTPVEKEEVIDLTGIKPGIYLIKLVMDNEAFTEPVIIQ